MIMFLVVCQCGKVKKGMEWVWVEDSFSSFIQALTEKIAIQNSLNGKNSSQKITSLPMLINECNTCRIERRRNERRKEKVL